MNYGRIYSLLITRAKKRDWRSSRWNIGSVCSKEDLEVHHILPKCMGGGDDRKNLAVLSTKEHYICHLLLTKIYPESGQIAQAFCIMCNRTEGKTARGYAYQKKKAKEHNRKTQKEFWTKEKRKEASKRTRKRYESPEEREKMSEAIKKKFKECPEIVEKMRSNAKEMWKDDKVAEKIRKGVEEYWNVKGSREERSKLIKEQNIKSPKLKEKRVSAIRNHMHKKSDEWKEKQSFSMKKICNTIENKERLKDLYHTSSFNNSRKVIDKKTKKEYSSIKKASEGLGINYNTMKKYLYNNSDKSPVIFKED